MTKYFVILMFLKEIIIPQSVGLLQSFLHVLNNVKCCPESKNLSFHDGEQKNPLSLLVFNQTGL